MGFTLIEVITVIMILAVLAVSILPAYRKITSNSNRHVAISESQAIASALMEYRRVYGTWPCEKEVTISDVPVITAGKKYADNIPINIDIDIGTVMRVLTGDTSPEYRKYNPRGIVFIELPESCYRKQEKDSIEYPYDPWGNPYVAVMSVAISDSSVSALTTTQQEGGISCAVLDENSMIQSPDPAVVFSWGDPIAAQNNKEKSRITGSWCIR